MKQEQRARIGKLIVGECGRSAKDGLTVAELGPNRFAIGSVMLIS